MAIKVNGKFVAGSKGEDGKSAYDYAVEGGYTGTEAEFQALMARAQNLDGGPFLPLSGGTMSGDIIMDNNGIQSARSIVFNQNDLPELTSSKNCGGIYFSGLNFHFLSPDSMTAGLIIRNPSEPNHATTKKYVDESIQKAISDSWAKAY